MRITFFLNKIIGNESSLLKLTLKSPAKINGSLSNYLSKASILHDCMEVIADVTMRWYCQFFDCVKYDNEKSSSVIKYNSRSTVIFTVTVTHILIEKLTINISTLRSKQHSVYQYTHVKQCVSTPMYRSKVACGLGIPTHTTKTAHIANVRGNVTHH